MAATTIIANLCVPVAFLIEPRLRRPFNYLLLNLAVSDLLNGTLSMTHFVIYTHMGYWPFGFKHCTFWIYIDWLTVNETLATIAVISMDRAWAVLFPMNYYRYNTNKKAVYLIAATWLVVNAGILPGQLYDRLYQGNFYGRYECYWDIQGPTPWAGPLYVVPFAEWIPFTVTGICYVVISLKIYRLSKGRARIATLGKPELDKEDRRWRKEKQGFLLLTLLFIALLVCWMPWFVYSGLTTYDGYEDLTAFMVTYWLGYSMSAVNPFLFNIANSDMRHAIGQMFHLAKRRIGFEAGNSSVAEMVVVSRPVATDT